MRSLNRRGFHGSINGRSCFFLRFLAACKRLDALFYLSKRCVGFNLFSGNCFQNGNSCIVPGDSARLVSADLFTVQNRFDCWSQLFRLFRRGARRDKLFGNGGGRRVGRCGVAIFRRSGFISYQVCNAAHKAGKAANKEIVKGIFKLLLRGSAILFESLEIWIDNHIFNPISDSFFRTFRHARCKPGSDSADSLLA